MSKLFKQLKSNVIFNLSICLLMLITTSAHAVIVDGIDLRVTMKQMRFEYSQAMQTDSVDTFNKHIQQFKEQLLIAKKFKYPEEKQVKASEGLKKVTTALDSISEPVTLENLASIQQKLQEIDELRTQYHVKKLTLWDRFWQLIFGVDESLDPLIQKVDS